MSDELERLRYLRLKAKAAGTAPSEPVQRAVETGPAPKENFGDEVNPLATMALRAGQGLTFGRMDEIGSGVDALIDKVSGKDGTLSELYDSNLKRNRALIDANSEAYPKLGFASELGGGVVGAGKAAGALGLAKAVANLSRGQKAAVAIGAALGGGAAAGTGNSTAEVGSADYGIDAGLGAGFGLVGAGVGSALAKSAPALFRAASRKLQEMGIGAGRRVLQGGSDLASARTKPLAAEAVREALESGAIVPFGTVGGAAKRLDVNADALGKVYGEILEQLEARGVRGPEARAIANKMTGAGATARAEGADAVANVFDDEASKMGRYLAGSTDDRIALSAAEGVKRRLQKQARYGKYEDTPTNEAKKEMAAIFREANEQAVAEAGQGSTDAVTKELAESFLPVKQRLSRTIAARDAAEIGAGKAAQRNAMGLAEKIAAMTAVPAGPGAVASTIGGTRILQSLMNRGGSAVARGAYGAGKAAGAAARAAQNAPNRALHGAAGGIVSADELAALLEFLRKKDDGAD